MTPTIRSVTARAVCMATTMGLRDFVEKRRAEQKPKTLAELKARKDAEKRKPRTLAELRKAKQAQRSAKYDFAVAGVKYHNVQKMDGYWTVDMTNGDKTYTLHNRHGAWFHDVGHDGRMVEPVAVGRALGISDSQLDISMSLSRRLEREFRARGIPTREQLLRQHEEEAKASRRKTRKTSDD
jgi:hypothetical protein